MHQLKNEMICEEKKESQIEQEISIINLKLDTLDNQMDKLQVRLSDILRAEIPLPAETKEENPLVPLAFTIHEIGERVQNQINCIQNIIERLEL